MPMPTAVMDNNGEYLWRNYLWIDLAPFERVPFIWPLDFFSRIQYCLDRQARSIIRSVQLQGSDDVYDIWMSPYNDQSDQVLVVAHDVSVYQEFAAKDRMEERVKEASIMIQGILHEMRNPLAGIKATAQLLARLKPKDAKPHLDQIIGDVSRIDMIFQELTLLAGEIRLHKQVSNLHAILEQVIEHLDALVQERQIDLKRDYDPSLPEIEVDVHRMYRVYLNVLRNAIEATPTGGRITIKTRVQSDHRHGHLWVTQILDDGEGISPEAKSMLFAPLFTTKKLGTGLGLPVSMQIVQAHGGNFSLENQTKKGAVATITLPIDTLEIE